MTEHEAAETGEQALENGLLAWFQGFGEEPPSLLGISSKNRLDAAGVSKDELEELRVAINNGEEARRIPLWLYFSGFEECTLDGILGEGREDVIGESIKVLVSMNPGLFTEHEPEPPAPSVLPGVGSVALKETVAEPVLPESETPKESMDKAAYVLDIGQFERLLEDVPGRFSPMLTAEEREIYEAASIERWQSLRIKLATVLEIEAAELDNARIASMLVESAQFQPTRTQSRLPNGYRAMYMVMLWKYLDGAPREDIQRAAYSVDKEYMAKVSAIRTGFISFVEDHINLKAGVAKVKTVARRPSPYKRQEKLMHDTAEGNRRLEQDHALVYHENRRREIHDSGPEKAGLAARLAVTFGGNPGAYSEVFNIVAEVLVEERDVPDVRNRLWGAVVRNLKQWAPTSAARLNNEEVKWLAPLCGKKLLANKETKRLEPVDAEPLSLDEMKVLAHNLYEKGAYGDQPPRTADEVEYIILSACRKLIG